jgi:hypothetical protein
MTTLTITSAIENELNLTADAWLIVNGDDILGIYEGKDAARNDKVARQIKGKIVEAAKCEFTVAELPDETITPEDEEQLAAELDAEEEVIVLTKREPADVNAAAVLLGVGNVMNTEVCPECGSEELYAGRNKKGLVVDEEYIIGCHHCSWEVDTRKTKSAGPKRGRNEKQIEAAKTSKKLNRAVLCVETAQQWDKVGDIHKLNPELMTWGQCGAARAKMYAAAKNGELITVTVAGKNYRLVSVE